MSKKKLPHIAFPEEAIAPPVPGGQGIWGAQISFAGVVRETEENKPLTGILYSAYLPMAETVMRRIAADAGDRFPDHGLWMEHRLGFVPAGEPSLHVMVSTPHSREGFEISEFYLVAIKTRVPIWKQPVFADDEAKTG